MKRQFLLTIAAVCPLFAQSGAIPESLGYSAPPAFLAAPGQVETLFLHDIPPATDGSLRSAQAPAGPLPSTLAGITVHINQDNSTLPAAISPCGRRMSAGTRDPRI